MDAPSPANRKSSAASHFVYKLEFTSEGVRASNGTPFRQPVKAAAVLREVPHEPRRLHQAMHRRDFRSSECLGQPTAWGVPRPLSGSCDRFQASARCRPPFEGRQAEELPNSRSKDDRHEYRGRSQNLPRFAAMPDILVSPLILRRPPAARIRQPSTSIDRPTDNTSSRRPSRPPYPCTGPWSGTCTRASSGSRAC